MNWGIMFYLNSLLFGVGLAMDAFSVSMANGLNEPKMKTSKAIGIAVLFAFFQALMPMIGWICVHTVLQYFRVFEKFIPWVSLAVLSFIGGKMIHDGLSKKENDEEIKVGICALIVQGIATSIDALSVGLQISEYELLQALVSSLIIAAVTFVICFAGVYIGKKFGTFLSDKAQLIGGAILIFIGLEIFVTGLVGC